MPWCPRCRLEYREGFERCSECEVPLVEKLPEEPVAEAEEEDVPVFLVSAADGFEAEILEAKLKAYGVPVMKKHREAGDYLSIYMGASPFGIDLYVPSKLIDRAREILDAVPEATGEDGEEEAREALLEEHEMKEASERYKEKGRMWLFLLIGIPALIYLLFMLLSRK